MSTIILLPDGSDIGGWINNLTPEPSDAVTYNYNKVNYFPDPIHLFDKGVYCVNNALFDFYACSNLASDLLISFNSISVFTNCAKDDATDNCYVEQAKSTQPESLPLEIASVPIELNLDSNNNLSSFTWISNLLEPLDISSINSTKYGLRLTSSGVTSKAFCNQLYVSVDVDVVGEIASNIIESDVIHVNQNFSVIIQEDKGRSLFNATSINILYKKPNGVEGSIDVNVIDANRIIGTFPSSLNDMTGKYWFKLYAVMETSVILEGVPFFTNIQPEWI